LDRWPADFLRITVERRDATRTGEPPEHRRMALSGR
jgi:hypothetical protein